MSQEGTPVPMSLRVAMQISGIHFMMNSRISGACMFFLIVHGMVVVKLLGVEFPDGALQLWMYVRFFIHDHHWWFIALYLIIFSFPANLGALIVLTRYQFGSYRVYPVYHKPIVQRIPMLLRDSNSWSRSRLLTYCLRMQRGVDELWAWLTDRAKSRSLQ